MERLVPQRMDIRDDRHRIYEEWSAAVRHRDVDALTSLYSSDATFESPAILLLGDCPDGVIAGHEEIASFFNSIFDRVDVGIADWLKTGDLFLDGNMLSFESTAEIDGTSTRSVETLEIEQGKIRRHRVYWSWEGWKALRHVLPARERPARATTLVLVKSDK